MLAELREKPWPELRGILAKESIRAAVALADTARLFQEPRDPLRAVTSPRFVAETREVAVALLVVVGLPWPGVPDADRERATAAYTDIAEGCGLLAGGVVPRPDTNSFLTNVAKAIGCRGGPIRWTFSTLPDWT
ncbi:hypothetical protein [Microvirga tunisiensis]|uniref:Uncharacterized protein n=1 Tax=Microvirga tunisiensis TaxID=2108360 RepID=A0A5N7MX06_9HYPH|nr:hypothetical protein [Microvirga tunisiensis]MPR13649.1 hypothetical protein [Microvirga tunisiensis]MPR31495.1 hypothetical protein [Microvirga tunisiensis]